MRPVRNVLNELVERRLWPLALVLVLALVAVPLLLGKSPAPAADEALQPDAPPAAATPVSPAGAPVVSVTQAGGATSRLRGHAKNPFRQQYVQTTPSSTATATSSVTSTTPAPAGGGSPSAPSGAVTQPQQPPAKVYLYASIDVRFGHAGGSLRRIGDVPRLTPLPSSTHPIVVFLGVRRDLATAVFLVSTDVHVQGRVRCVPSRSNCQAIELRAGDTALLDVRAADGSVRQYELDLDRVVLHRTTSKQVAQSAYARVSRAGAALLRDRANTSAEAVAPPLRIPFRYVQRLGVLHLAPWVARLLRSHDAFSAMRDVAGAWGVSAP